MGNNNFGQLGIDDPYTHNKCSPVLVEALVSKKPYSISCGSNHTLALMKNGDVYAWGCNEHG